METKYAPAERDSQEKIISSYHALEKYPYLYEVFCALSYVFCILNDKRQVVFANDVMVESLGLENVELLLGKRIGEAFGCIHSGDESGGCGTSEHCRFCGAVNAMLESNLDAQKTTKECRIRRIVDQKETSMELEVTATPFDFGGERYTIFSLLDITDKRRKMMIERIFFHDILNTAGGLSNIFEIYDIVDEKEKKELLSIASSLSRQIIDEITTQRLLVQAENMSLTVKNERINSFEFLEMVDKDLKYHEVAKGKNIVLDKSSDCLFFQSDPVLLRKILNNMIKNALEASSLGETIMINVRKKGDKIRFSVHNNAFMNPDVEMQVFMRSFSTKGIQRGLGTYSMKILGEQYLGGKVNFETNKDRGTTFYIDLDFVESE
jgi:PAS domain-containing protein